MITIIKALQRVTGSEIILWGTIICIIISIGIFIAFKFNRSKKSILIYLLALLITFEVCDFIWLSYLFPNREYFNRGLIGGAIFLILPLFLLIITTSLTVFNKHNKS